LVLFLDVQNDFGVINNGLVYALYDYDPDSSTADELQFKDGDQLRILRRGDENETEWWWAKHEQTEKEGYVPRNYLGVGYR
jgi:apoptosis-stimulating of p53 protein 1